MTVYFGPSFEPGLRIGSKKSQVSASSTLCWYTHILQCLRNNVNAHQVTRSWLSTCASSGYQALFSPPSRAWLRGYMYLPSLLLRHTSGNLDAADICHVQWAPARSLKYCDLALWAEGAMNVQFTSMAYRSLCNTGFQAPKDFSRENCPGQHIGELWHLGWGAVEDIWNRKPRQNFVKIITSHLSVVLYVCKL